MKRRKKFDNRAIVMLCFGLVAIIAIMVQMRNSLPKPPSEIAQLNGKRIGIVDSVYINLPFHFMIKRPNASWQFEIVSQDSVIAPLDLQEKNSDQILWLVSGTRNAESVKDSADRRPQAAVGQQRTENGESRESFAVAQIGILAKESRTTSNELAITLFAEMIEQYELDGGRVIILQQVTGPAHQILKGDYCVFIAPEQARVAFPVHIIAVLPRGDLFYIIVLKVKEQSYRALRDELQEFVQRFHPLPSRF